MKPILTLLAALLTATAAQAADATNLRCEYLNNPVGIDVTEPRLSWNMQENGPASDLRGLQQTAYQVLVADGVVARYVRVTATKLWNRKSGGNPFCFALKQLEVISTGENAEVQASVTAKDSAEGAGWAFIPKAID